MSKRLYEFNLTEIEKCRIYNDLTQEFLSNKNVIIKDEYWQSLYCDYIRLTQEPITNGYKHVLIVECDPVYFENHRYLLNKYSNVLDNFDRSFENKKNLFDILV